MTKTGSKSKKMNKKWDDDQISTFIVPKGHVAWDYCKRWPRDLTQPLIPYQTSCVCSVLVLVFLLMCTLAVFSQIVNALVSTSFKCLASLRGWINVFATIYNSLMHLREKKTTFEVSSVNDSLCFPHELETFQIRRKRWCLILVRIVFFKRFFSTPHVYMFIAPKKN